MHQPARWLYGQPYLLLMMTALFWGGNSIASRLAVSEVSPFVIVFYRWAIVCLLLIALNYKKVRASWPVLKPKLPLLAGMATVGFTGFNAIFYVAGHHTSAINIGILQGSIPVIVLLGAFLLYATPVKPLQIVGTLVTIAGVIVVASAGDIDRLLNLQFGYGDGLMMIACILYASYTLALKRRPEVSGIVLMTVLAFFALITSIPLVAYEIASGEAQMPTGTGWLVILYITLFPSFLAQIFFMRGVELIGPGRAGVFVNLVPVFSAILAIVILNESFLLFHGLALALVLGGIYIAERQKAVPPVAPKPAS
ncbi:MAG: DMT family transporter [Stappiaceae bacterium]